MVWRVKSGLVLGVFGPDKPILPVILNKNKCLDLNMLNTVFTKLPPLSDIFNVTLAINRGQTHLRLGQFLERWLTTLSVTKSQT